ncbi:MAG: hypothetical protein HY785_22450 [Oscillatoriophycideae cyanobacterium NC_groundwater_1537_Pr4_S-0.65um_50_18]|nr:hypothetical protein [Oscillatoriophycideae cyanobacterium NC_groundwater_1537_Pr4_S-0.65um_50_18]
MHSTISQNSITATQSGQEVFQYVAFLHCCITSQPQQTLTLEQQTRLEKFISRRI